MQKQTWICRLAILVFLFSLFGSADILSASDEHEGWLDRGEVALRQALVDLTNDMTILCLAAHPDDEDGATLTYYRRKHGVRTAILYSTRGEGGQNEIGPELYEELGVIRAHEIQKAASIYGAEVYDLNKRDFGYSKSAEEAFRFWGHEDSLRRMVSVIREVRPDVIITNHDTEHGHGHHQATGIIALEAFYAAADASKFPEELGEKPWQVKRLFHRSGKEDADVTINVGEYDQTRGYSYAQITSEGFKMHKSQGMDGNVKRGPGYRYYKLIRSSTPATEKLNSLLDGLTNEIEKPEFVERALGSAFIPNDQLAEDVVGYLRAARKRGLKMESPEFSEEEEELKIAAAKALDLYLTVEADDDIITPGQEFTVNVSLTNCGHQIIENVGLYLIPALPDWTAESEYSDVARLGYNETVTGSFKVMAAGDTPLTLPQAEHLYESSFMKPLLKGVALYGAFDTALSIKSSGTVNISADLELHILPETSILPASTEDQTVRYVVNVINRMSSQTKGRVEFLPPADWNVSGMKQDFDLTENQQAFAAFDMTIPSGAVPGDFPLKARAFYDTSEVRSDSIETEGIVKIVDVKVADDLYVGYVKSYDNTLERTLKQLNVRSRALDGDDLRFGDLSVYDTIILDIRAYLAREDLRQSNQRLLDYVSDGGNLVVMYNKTYEWNGRQYAPYKLVLSRNRVTVEEAPIAILATDHPLFTFPNRIGEKDWDGWIQERGLYFPSEYAPEYKELLSCNDPDEEPLRGGYLVAQYGQGTYVYTSYVWYRQLQILNSGALRNFANMISLPKSP